MTSTHTSLSLTVDELSERILANLGAIHDYVHVEDDVIVTPVDDFDQAAREWLHDFSASQVQPMTDWERELAGLTFQEAYGFGQH